MIQYNTGDTVYVNDHVDPDLHEIISVIEDAYTYWVQEPPLTSGLLVTSHSAVGVDA